MSPVVLAQRRFQTDEEYVEEQLLVDLESELRHVQALKLQNQQRVEQLLQERKYLEQQQRRFQRQQDRQDTGTATARMLQMQEKERERFAAAQAKYEREEKEAKDEVERTRRCREHTIETQDEDLDDLEVFLAQDAANF
ncbi:unnamed protein product [Peronospora belbahrii]|uniref:Uncharacterized protein n=1 Tax=Peronospora belbahrii TaxID=622444 RepID=A0AAU9KN02_9STRA|nr:unnamed protein product [Peronospora belbahrii]CAH0520041.1 unnamed protein product [Peronospora belbahrii]